jgi:hypothetical protein
MMENRLFDDLVKSLHEAKDIAQGKAKPSRHFVVEREPDDEEQDERQSDKGISGTNKNGSTNR